MTKIQSTQAPSAIRIEQLSELSSSNAISESEEPGAAEVSLKNLIPLPATGFD